MDEELLDDFFEDELPVDFFEEELFDEEDEEDFFSDELEDDDFEDFDSDFDDFDSDDDDEALSSASLTRRMAVMSPEPLIFAWILYRLCTLLPEL